MTRFLPPTAQTGLLTALILLSVSCDRRKPAETSGDGSPAETAVAPVEAPVAPAEARVEFHQANPAAEPLPPLPPIKDSPAPREWLESIRNSEDDGRNSDSAAPPLSGDREDPERPERTAENAVNPSQETIDAVRRLLERAGFPATSVSGGSQTTGGKGELTLHEVEARFADDDGKRVLVFRLADGIQEHAGSIFDEYFAPFTAGGYYIRLFDGPGDRAARTNTFDREREAVVWQQDGVLMAAIGFAVAEAERIHTAAVGTGMYVESD